MEVIFNSVAAGFFRRNVRSEGAAEGGCGGNSAAPERSAGAKRRRASFPQNGFAQSLEYPTKTKNLRLAQVFWKSRISIDLIYTTLYRYLFGIYTIRYLE